MIITYVRTDWLHGLSLDNLLLLFDIQAALHHSAGCSPVEWSRVEWRVANTPPPKAIKSAGFVFFFSNRARIISQNNKNTSGKMSDFQVRR